MSKSRLLTRAAIVGLFALTACCLVFANTRADPQVQAQASAELCTLTIRLIPALNVPVTFRVDSSAEFVDLPGSGPEGCKFWFENLAPTEPGVFVLHNVPRNNNAFDVEAKGFLGARAGFDGRKDGKADVTVRLDPGLGISGRVVGKDGIPIPGAVVESKRWWRKSRPYRLDRRMPTSFPAPAVSGSDGEFTIWGHLDEAYYVRVVKDGTPSKLILAEPLAGRNADVGDIELRPIGTIRGRVVLPEDLIPAVKEPFDKSYYAKAVSIAPADGQMAASLPVGYGGPTLDLASELVGSVVVLDDGLRFETPPLPPGPYFVGYAIGGESLVMRVEVPEGGMAQADLVLGQYGSIEGTVLDAKGEPLAGISVRQSGYESYVASSGWLTKSESVSGKDGHFRLDRIPAGIQRIGGFIGTSEVTRFGTGLVQVSPDKTTQFNLQTDPSRLKEPVECTVEIHLGLPEGVTVESGRAMHVDDARQDKQAVPILRKENGSGPLQFVAKRPGGHVAQFRAALPEHLKPKGVRLPSVSFGLHCEVLKNSPGLVMRRDIESASLDVMVERPEDAGDEEVRVELRLEHLGRPVNDAPLPIPMLTGSWMVLDLKGQVHGASLGFDLPAGQSGVSIPWLPRGRYLVSVSMKGRVTRYRTLDVQQGSMATLGVGTAPGSLKIVIADRDHPEDFRIRASMAVGDGYVAIRSPGNEYPVPASREQNAAFLRSSSGSLTFGAIGSTQTWVGMAAGTWDVRVVIRNCLEWTGTAEVVAGEEAEVRVSLKACTRALIRLRGDMLSDRVVAEGKLELKGPDGWTLDATQWFWFGFNAEAASWARGSELDPRVLDALIQLPKGGEYTLEADIPGFKPASTSFKVSDLGRYDMPPLELAMLVPMTPPAKLGD